MLSFALAALAVANANKRQNRRLDHYAFRSTLKYGTAFGVMKSVAGLMQALHPN